jgi:hypothetical protein
MESHSGTNRTTFAHYEAYRFDRKPTFRGCLYGTLLLTMLTPALVISKLIKSVPATNGPS